MTTRRNRTALTPDQLADAARLKAIFMRAKSAAEAGGRGRLSQDAVAAACGMNQSAASQYMNGHIPLNFSALLNFAAFFGVHPRAISPALTAKIEAVMRPDLETAEIAAAGEQNLPDLLRAVADRLARSEKPQP